MTAADYVWMVSLIGLFIAVVLLSWKYAPGDPRLRYPWYIEDDMLKRGHLPDWYCKKYRITRRQESQR